ncbi:hypothetical protein L0337_11080 [candidate division KSB1 bacterium]|nr:hypothetical protein [candidate division KSB1 bacterium]
MLRLLLVLSLAWGILAPSAAQSVIKILQFDKAAGIIDCGENAGLRVGDVFEVNRYAGDFVYWIGRVEVVVVKPKMAGVKTLALADNAIIQTGDVLELRKRNSDPLLEKPREAVKTAVATRQGKIETVERGAATPSWSRANPIMLGFSSGVLQPLFDVSQSLGLNLSVQIIDPSNNEVVRQIDMSHAYAASYALQAYGSLPFAERLALNLDYAFAWLNVRSGVESSLLDVGVKASGSLMKIGAALNWRLNGRLQLDTGVGLFLPQLTVTGGRQTITVSERQWGVTTSASYFIPLGAAVWLKPVLGYNIFRDDDAFIHYLNFQIGPSFAIKKP